ncbi:MAG: tetratricopeptide repeat protein [Candidatus Obscuribacterales bacterium]|nr:tetratricopeptide repeat protein [Candidatus Obscuribacterales bacterium]
MNTTMTAQSPEPLSMYEAQALESRAGKAADKGDWSQASQLLLLGLENRKAAAGTTDPGYARVLDRLAETYIRQDKVSEAQTTLSEACQILESAYYPEHGLLAPVLEHQADCLIKEGNYAEAEPILKRAKEIYAKTATMENRMTLGSINKLVKLYLTLNKPAEAKAELQKAMKHVDTPLGPIAEFHYQLALADIQTHDIAEARQLLQSAIADFKQRHNYSRVADCLETYAKICRESGDIIEADESVEQAEKYRRRGIQAPYPEDIFLATLLRA